jgi:hypothetical protein
MGPSISASTVTPFASIGLMTRLSQSRGVPAISSPKPIRSASCCTIHRSDLDSPTGSIAGFTPSRMLWPHETRASSSSRNVVVGRKTCVRRIGQEAVDDDHEIQLSKSFCDQIRVGGLIYRVSPVHEHHADGRIGGFDQSPAQERFWNRSMKFRPVGCFDRLVEKTLEHPERRPFRRLPPQHVKLMTQNRGFSLKRDPRPERSDQRQPN